MRIKERAINRDVYITCIENGYPEIVARIIAGRTDTFDKNIYEFSLDAIKSADTMADCSKAAKRIAKAINNHETILLFTDYDVDGCTSMAVLYGTLHDVFGVPDSRIIRLTGHRNLDGYGLTDPLADKIIALRKSYNKNLCSNKDSCSDIFQSSNKSENCSPTLVITADAGASDGARIARLAEVGIDVIVTDHHIIPKDGIPATAYAVVNPQRENCQYDPNIAGCGVSWLLMTALSREMGCTKEQKIKIHQLLDLVALGTVADLVPLTSVINRYFVKKGLEFMNRKTRPCWQVALNGREADSEFLAFHLGPRINASSRITSEATTAIDFLIADDFEKVASSYQQLGMFNSDRQKIEKEMFNAAEKYFCCNDEVTAFTESVSSEKSKNDPIAIDTSDSSLSDLSTGSSSLDTSSSDTSSSGSSSSDTSSSGSSSSDTSSSGSSSSDTSSSGSSSSGSSSSDTSSSGSSSLDTSSPDTSVSIKMPIIIYYSENNHPGIQGIVAGKLTETFGVPSVMIADIGDSVVVGSGRAGQFLHIRDALQTFDNRYPNVFIAYGGHRAAAGFKLHKDNLKLFQEEFPKIVMEQLEEQDTTPYIQTDGSLKGGQINQVMKKEFIETDNGLENSSNESNYKNGTLNRLNSQINLDTYFYIEALKPFGNGFPAPLFYDQMVATDVKVMGKNPVHLSMMLDGVKAAFFNALKKPDDPLPVRSGDVVDVVYTLNLNSWQGRENLQLIVKKISLRNGNLITP